MSMNTASFISNLKLHIRNQIGRNSVWATKRKELAIKKDMDLCVEGYPRSANTYSVLLIEKYANRPLGIAHHLHMPSQIKMASSWGIPSVLLIRKPMQAIPSLILREKGVSHWNAVNWYNLFHEELVDQKDKLIIWDFEELINNPLKCLQELDRRTGILQMDKSLARIENEDIFQEIDRLDKETKEGQDLSLVNSRPNKQKSMAKKVVRNELLENPRYQKMIKKSEDLYEFFTAK